MAEQKKSMFEGIEKFEEEFEDDNDYSNSLWGFNIKDRFAPAPPDPERENFEKLKKTVLETKDPNTQYELAQLYEEGKVIKFKHSIKGTGTSQDFEMAFHYYFISSQQGHEQSIARIDQLMIDYDDDQMRSWIDRSTEISFELENSTKPTPSNQSHDFTEIQQQMKNELNFLQVPIPAAEKPHATIWLSSSDISNKVILIIPGNQSQPGKWSPQQGENFSMLPLLKKLTKPQQTVIVLNPYVNTGNARGTFTIPDIESVDEDTPIQGSESALKHTNFVFDNFIIKNNVKQVSIVACGQGGTCALSLFASRAIALIDSSHRIAGLGYGMSKVSKTLYDIAEKRTVNWRHSALPFNSPLPNAEGSMNFSSGSLEPFQVNQQLVDEIDLYLTKCMK